MLQPYGGQVLSILTVFIGSWKSDQLAFLGISVGYTGDKTSLLKLNNKSCMVAAAYFIASATSLILESGIRDRMVCLAD